MVDAAIVSVLEKIMKIITNSTAMPNHCAECDGVDNRMIRTGSSTNWPVYLCLSCAQEAGRLAELEQAREAKS